MSIQILSLNGSVVKEQLITTADRQSLDVTTLQSGIYLIKAAQNNKSVWMKMIKK